MHILYLILSPFLSFIELHMKRFVHKEASAFITYERVLFTYENSLNKLQRPCSVLRPQKNSLALPSIKASKKQEIISVRSIRVRTFLSCVRIGVIQATPRGGSNAL